MGSENVEQLETGTAIVAVDAEGNELARGKIWSVTKDSVWLITDDDSDVFVPRAAGFRTAA